MTTLAMTANNNSLEGPVSAIGEAPHSVEKIEVTKKDQGQSDEPNFCQHSSSSLLRLFESSVFNVHYAIHYLFNSTEPGVQEYLARRLFSFPNEEVDFYLPQLATLFVRFPAWSTHLSAYFSHRASTSIRFATQLAWLLETLTAEDSASAPATNNTLPTHDVSPPLLPHRASKLQMETSMYPADSAEENRNSLPTPRISISAGEVFPATACDDIALREMTVDSSDTVTSNGGAATMPPRFAALHRQDLRRGTTAGHVRWVPSASSSGSDSAIPYTASTISPVTRVGSILDKRYANATLTKHKRTTSDLTNIISTQALRAAAARETMAVLSEPGTGRSTDDSMSADPFSEGGGDDVDLGDGDGAEKDDRHTQAAEEKSARSRSWINVHKGGRLMQQYAALSEGQLSNNVTPFSGLLPTSPHLTHLLDQLSTFSQPGHLASFCMGEWDFIHALISISRRLTNFSCKEQRTGHLQAELAKLNLNLPARVWLPVERTEHVVLRIPPSAAVCLNSAERAPYLLFVEVLVCDDITRLRLPPRTGSFSGLAPSNILNHCFHDTHLFTSPLVLSSSKPAHLHGTQAIANPDVISLFSTDSGSFSGGAGGGGGVAGDEVYTDAANTVSLTSLPSSSSSCSSSSIQFAVKPTTPVVNRPRMFPHSDPHHLYCIKAVEIRRRLEENTAYQPQRSFKLDPKDPSAAVLKEPLELKARRIQESSPWGHLPGWQLAAVIVKVGDDLRQEQLAYQLLTVLQKIWAENLLKLWLRPLNIIVTSGDTGLIELVPDTVSLHQIRRHTRLSLRDYIIREHGPPNSEGFLTAQMNFVRSCAAYCLVGYLFQVKDRHNGNILIDKEGHVIHIDYGFMLSASPGKNFGFETSPFKLTSEQVDLMGGVDNDMFQYYKFLILRGLLAARKHMEELCLLVDIARVGYPHLPCFSKAGGAGALAALRQRFLLTRTEESLQTFVSNMVDASLHSFTTPLYDSYQYYTNGIQ